MIVKLLVAKSVHPQQHCTKFFWLWHLNEGFGKNGICEDFAIAVYIRFKEISKALVF